MSMLRQLVDAFTRQAGLPVSVPWPVRLAAALDLLGGGGAATLYATWHGGLALRDSVGTASRNTNDVFINSSLNRLEVEDGVAESADVGTPAFEDLNGVATAGTVVGLPTAIRRAGLAGCSTSDYISGCQPFSAEHATGAFCLKNVKFDNMPAGYWNGLLERSTGGGWRLYTWNGALWIDSLDGAGATVGTHNRAINTTDTYDIIIWWDGTWSVEIYNRTTTTWLLGSSGEVLGVIQGGGTYYVGNRATLTHPYDSTTPFTLEVWQGYSGITQTLARNYILGTGDQPADPDTVFDGLNTKVADPDDATKLWYNTGTVGTNLPSAEPAGYVHPVSLKGIRRLGAADDYLVSDENPPALTGAHSLFMAVDDVSSSPGSTAFILKYGGVVSARSLTSTVPDRIRWSLDGSFDHNIGFLDNDDITLCSPWVGQITQTALGSALLTRLYQAGSAQGQSTGARTAAAPTDKVEIMGDVAGTTGDIAGELSWVVLDVSVDSSVVTPYGDGIHVPGALAYHAVKNGLGSVVAGMAIDPDADDGDAVTNSTVAAAGAHTGGYTITPGTTAMQVART